MPAQVALKLEEADYQTEISVVQGPVWRQGQLLCEGGHPEWWEQDGHSSQWWRYQVVGEHVLNL